VVKEKQQARVEYKEAVDRGETAALLEQLPEAADVFTTRVGNVPANEHVTVEIVYLGELKHDAETDGSRFTIPTVIAPRYGSLSSDSSNLPNSTSIAGDKGGIRILVDVSVDEGSTIRGLQSPSHPIAMTMGRTSSMPEDAFANHFASATLTLGSTELDKDFIVVVLAKGQDTPRAMLEHHPTLKGHRALMATLVPKFDLPPIHPEIVFIVDRSGSMEGKIEMVVEAMKIFLKSLPVGVKFNICSFGSNHTFLWPKSKTYDQSSLYTAMKHLDSLSANYGGTEMLQPVKATVKNRYKDMPLEVLILTDGEIWNQEELFNFINKSEKEAVRCFSLGIGSGASSSLVEGIARAGNGFAQFVGHNEKMDKRVVRMLKGALTPHITDYTLEVQYEKEDEEFEMVERVTDCLSGLSSSPVNEKSTSGPVKKVISLFDTSAKVTRTNSPAGRYDHLPAIATPKLLQAPHKIPALYPFNRTAVYLLMSAEGCQRTPQSVVLRATCEHGPLALEIPIQDVGFGETVHQLAAKKAVQELEEGRGWITEVKDDSGKLIKDKYEGRWDEFVEREAVRLGVQYQVGGKWCSFVAVEANSRTGEEQEQVINNESSGLGGRPASRPSYHQGSLGAGQSPIQAGKGRSALFSASPSSSLSRWSQAFGAPLKNSSQGTGMVATGMPSRPPPAPIPMSMSHSCAQSSLPEAQSTGFAPPGFGAQIPKPQVTEVDFRIRSQQGLSSSAAFAAPGCSRGSRGGAMAKVAPRRRSARMAYDPTIEDTMKMRGEEAFLARNSDAEEDELDKMDVDRRASQAPPTNQEQVHALISLQNFDGSWTWSKALCSTLGIGEEKLTAMIASAVPEGNSTGGAGNVKATLAVVAFFKARLTKEEEVWEMVVEKAISWLRQEMGGDVAGSLRPLQLEMAALPT
jgi:hypothetical protein